MKSLLDDISALRIKECDRAPEKLGTKNNSHHESYAIILEEFEEASDHGIGIYF